MKIRACPDHSGAYNNLSICYTEMNDLIKAQEFAEMVHKLKPFCPDYLYALGGVKSKLGNNEEALELFKQADLRDPRKIDIMHALADSYIAVKQTDRAVKILEKMTLLFSNDPFLKI
jgi:tetratricopeptide (TPR) repeat protein